MPVVISADFPFVVLSTNKGAVPPDTVLHPADGSGTPVVSCRLDGENPVFVRPVCNCYITYRSVFGGNGYTVAYSEAVAREKVARLIWEGCTDIVLRDAAGNELVFGGHHV